MRASSNPNPPVPYSSWRGICYGNEWQKDAYNAQSSFPTTSCYIDQEEVVSPNCPLSIVESGRTCLSRDPMLTSPIGNLTRSGYHTFSYVTNRTAMAASTYVRPSPLLLNGYPPLTQGP